MENFRQGRNSKLLLSENKGLTLTGGRARQQIENDSRKTVSGKAIYVLCVACFLAGSFFRVWTNNVQNKDQEIPINFPNHVSKFRIKTIINQTDIYMYIYFLCYVMPKSVDGKSVDIMGEVIKTHQAIQSLDKTISALEMELAVARTSNINVKNSLERESYNPSLQKAFVVIGINTAFSSKKKRDSVGQTWLPTGEELRKMEKEKGIVITFVTVQHQVEFLIKELMQMKLSIKIFLGSVMLKDTMNFLPRLDCISQLLFQCGMLISMSRHASEYIGKLQVQT